MAQAQSFEDLQTKLLEMAKQLTEALKPQSESRKDIAKTLVSLSSAALLFTIIFASSLLKPNSSFLLRYTIAGCWLAFIFSLTLSLFSLWFSIGLYSFPALLMTKTEKIKEIAKDGESLATFVANIWEKELVPADKRSRRSLLAAFISYGIAILILFIVGVWQFIL